MDRTNDGVVRGEWEFLQEGEWKRVERFMFQEKEGSERERARKRKRMSEIRSKMKIGAREVEEERERMTGRQSRRNVISK